ncbi:SAGA histone acetylase and TREX-2 complexes component [Saccharomyces cerevisiae]|uniref:SAGA complex subunit SUS1 n=3 Tax=Saccharomyces cerevisiae TaxID=4932 RepID=SUS1_YEAST|nr:Sus1p [Saccharomyces cerevisiae S288C]Q6WNK7.1 RecName: Full=Transcription and mRNA export factor SUS1 [Saccharomyces cerevisiae S288C]3FWB_C Chain C, Protein SUS1 [Saccharomyces cerevisiae]3FWC_C Chain C, Protein SUS1 [Saccharomyces cerevisiae]3FWC_D Chain D, Protein SUS1 [Saccharomyces cerevisiae]3FWC_G Chain G, Protein SUS1 [Saccharomyces cerevisiae]3FWC_H Chain H, Protein SUS1 [Saccharomyces cerevisiae]3FWC_K Chain K, Protein SUS1 [Saccharomyces cerevisiae]3FWC_L Chain L, Protein SUS|eukprot:NP_878049.2 Sus1p [Saccharomyces cerevisiae S288C]
MTMDTAQLKSQIQQYLVESGNYELISNELKARLLQEGWVDKVKDLTKSEMNINESTNFTQILSTVEPKALEMVSDSTRETVLKQIREFLEEIVDTQ